MITSPIAGFLLGGLLMFLLLVALRSFTPHLVHSIFGKLQLVSAAWMAHSHGTNDAQKTMGIIALALFHRHDQRRVRRSCRRFLDFLHTPEFKVAPWVVVLCAATMAAGTAAGGWRIIRTLGHKMVKLQPVHGFAAETTAAVIIQVASSLRHSAFDHARHLHLHHGRRRGETFQRREVDRGRAHRLGLGFHPARDRSHRLYPGAGCRGLLGNDNRGWMKRSSQHIFRDATLFSPPWRS